MKMSWFYLIFFLSFIIGNLEAESNHHEKRHPSAVVVGTVYCDTCFQDNFSKASHFISGSFTQIFFHSVYSFVRFSFVLVG